MKLWLSSKLNGDLHKIGANKFSFPWPSANSGASTIAKTCKRANETCGNL